MSTRLSFDNIVDLMPVGSVLTASRYCCRRLCSVTSQKSRGYISRAVDIAGLTMPESISEHKRTLKAKFSRNEKYYGVKRCEIRNALIGLPKHVHVLLSKQTSQLCYQPTQAGHPGTDFPHRQSCCGKPAWPADLEQRTGLIFPR